MSADLRLRYLQTDLGLRHVGEDQQMYLAGLLTQAAAFVQRRGVALDEGSDADDMLVAMVAAWMYRARATATQPPLPPMIRCEIHDRLAAQKMRGDGDDL